MCCRRRRGGAYPAPLIVVLGKMAYDKYQERKARKLAANNQPVGLPGPDVRSSIANEEIVEKANINPPSYDSHIDFDEKNFDWTDAKGAIDDVATSFEEERMFGVANGMNHTNAPVAAQSSRNGGCYSRCQQKKAAKAARKAEKRAAQAAANELRM